jgi:hypothetical protein
MIESEQRSRVPFVTSFEDLVSFTSECIQNRTRVPQAVFVRSLALMLGLAEGHLREKSDVELKWDPTEWLSLMLSVIDKEVCGVPSCQSCILTEHSWKRSTFIEVDRVVSLVIVLQEHIGLQPSISLHSRPTIFRLVNTVSEYPSSN